MKRAISSKNLDTVNYEKILFSLTFGRDMRYMNFKKLQNIYVSKVSFSLSHNATYKS